MITESNKLYSNLQIQELEATACKTERCSSRELMERAGRAAFEAMIQRWPDCRAIAVFCGGGNNGGDGYVVARLAHEAGFKVEVRYLSDPKGLKGAALTAYQACSTAGVVIDKADKKIDLSKADLKAELMVDALLGTGLKGDVREEYHHLIDQINASGKPVIAIDTPSGLDTDTGYSHGVAINAALTVTFIGLKPGLYTGSGPACSGDIICDDLKISEPVFDKVVSNIRIINSERFDSLKKRVLKPRARDAHKGAFGHVLVVGGDHGMAGAARMASEAAARVGAGLTTVATHAEHIATITASRPELMAYAVEQPHQLEPLLKRATVVALGPGLGQTSWSQDLFNFILSTTSLPLVMDADALNLLSKVDHKKRCRANWILTPHPGEAARLLQVTPADIARDRIGAVREIEQRYGGICVLKGAGTLICDRKSAINICIAGNPGMATGGMGDVLTGVIAGLVAQTYHQGVEQDAELGCAASLGVALHAHAADRAAQVIGERGLLAMDLMAYL